MSQLILIEFVYEYFCTIEHITSFCTHYHCNLFSPNLYDTINVIIFCSFITSYLYKRLAHWEMLKSKFNITKNILQIKQKKKIVVQKRFTTPFSRLTIYKI